MISIAVTSVFVDDQSKALAFYTDVLGFEKRNDIPLGEARWLTVVSPAAPDGVELLLEPNGNPIAKTYQQSIFDSGLPTHLMLATDDIHAEYERLKGRGVKFTMEPTQAGDVTRAVFEDTCGNMLTLVQVGA